MTAPPCQCRETQMQRKVLLILGVFLVVLVAALPVAWQMRHSAPPMETVPPEKEAKEPLVREMECIDRVLRNSSLKSADVDNALARCR